MVRQTPGATHSLGARAATGVIWGAGGAIVYQEFALFVQTALTYFLTQAQYGSYGKAFAFLNFSMLLQQAGFTEILMRRREKLHLWMPVAFWFALTLGICGALLMATLAHPIALLYNDPQLATLLLLAAPLPVVRSLQVIPGVQLLEALRFRVHYGMMLLNALAISSLTLLLAWAGAGAESYAGAMLICEPLYVALLWRLARCRVTNRPRPSRWLLLARDLRFVFGSNVARWARSGIDPLVLGLFATSAVVGVYFFAQSMVSQIVRVVTLNLSSVLLPTLNRIGHDPDRQAAAFLRAARALMLIGAPCCLGLAAIAPLFVRVFLDAHKWDTLPPVLATLAIGITFRLLDEPVQTFIAARGRFRMGFHVSVGAAVLYVAACTLGAIGGNPLHMAIAAAAYYIVVCPLILRIALGGLATASAVIRVFTVPFVLATLAIAPWLMLDRWIGGDGRIRDGAVLALTVAAAGTTYLVLGRLFQPAGWRELTERLEAVAPAPCKALMRLVGGPSLSLVPSPADHSPL
jgi:O-antigen/teichoic acid export membrane protein